MRDGSAHVLRCLKVTLSSFYLLSPPHPYPFFPHPLPPSFPLLIPSSLSSVFPFPFPLPDPSLPQVWYDLPSDVFHTAVSNIDTFLAKMKVNNEDICFIFFCIMHWQNAINLGLKKLQFLLVSIDPRKMFASRSCQE